MNLAGLALVLIVGFVFGWWPWALIMFLFLCATRATLR